EAHEVGFEVGPLLGGGARGEVVLEEEDDGLGRAIVAKAEAAPAHGGLVEASLEVQVAQGRGLEALRLVQDIGGDDSEPAAGGLRMAVGAACRAPADGRAGEERLAAGGVAREPRDAGGE